MRLGKERLLQLVLDKVSGSNFGHGASATAYEYILQAVVGAYKMYDTDAKRWNAAMNMLMALPSSPMAVQNSKGMPQQCRDLINDMFGNISSGPKGAFPVEAALRNADAEDLLYYVSWMARFKSKKAREVIANNVQR